MPVMVKSLDALGEVELAERMYSDMTCEEALAFAHTLRAAANHLDKQYRRSPTKPKGAAWNGTWDAEKKEWVFETTSTFPEALATVREAADWFETVGEAGFGVIAWS